MFYSRLTSLCTEREVKITNVVSELKMGSLLPLFLIQTKEQLLDLIPDFRHNDSSPPGDGLMYLRRQIVA